MKTAKWSLGALFGAAILVAGCDQQPTGANSQSWFMATVDGAVSASYTGTGDFHLGKDHEGQAAFSLSSEGTGDAAGQSFLLHRSGAGMPGKGTYALGPQGSGFRAVYIRQVDGMMQAFAAQSGELAVAEANSDRVRGTFRLVGTQYCERAVRGSAAPSGPCNPTVAPAPGAPTVEITGSFTVAPLRGGVVLE
jgi:hypothetical protein